MSRTLFEERYKEMGYEVQDVVVRKSIRVNTLKISKEALRKRLVAKGVKVSDMPLSKDGLYIDSAKFSIGSTPEYLLGYYYIQEAASQFVSAFLNPKPGELVLDACAAPGGKTTHLSQLMKNRGAVVALDKKSKRMVALKNNLIRLGASNTICYSMDAVAVSKLDLEFDKILLDAPCSGNFTQDFDWFEKRNLEGINNNADNQKKLLEACFNVLKIGGTIVYATCSLEPEEDEQNTQWFKKNFDVELVEEKRFWPSDDNQGFYCAKFRRLK